MTTWLSGRVSAIHAATVPVSCDCTAFHSPKAMISRRAVSAGKIGAYREFLNFSYSGTILPFCFHLA